MLTRNYTSGLLTPAYLARAFALPFAVVVGGAAVMLALAAVTVGLNPAALAVDFLGDAAALLSPVALRLLLFWAVYTGFYLLLAWDFRFYAPRPGAGANPALAAFAGIFVRFCPGAVGLPPARTRALARYRFCGGGLSSTWAPGTHPQIE